MRILFVEDDRIIGEGVKTGLERRNFAVDWFQDGMAGRDAPETAQYDAAILDLSLPGMDGLDIQRHWRRGGRELPVLVLTARGTLEQRVEGLNLGADDYLGKPFALEELIARLYALARRGRGYAAPVLSHGKVSMDTVTRTVFLTGNPVAMSGRAVSLVELFLRNRRQVLSKSFIEEKLYPWGEEISSNAVEVHVHNIRRKLGASFIKTVYGVGYVLGDEA